MSRHRSRSEEHTSELQSRRDLVCRLLLEKKKDWVLDAEEDRYRRLARNMAVVISRHGPTVVFFFNDPATTEIYPLPLHDLLRIYQGICSTSRDTCAGLRHGLRGRCPRFARDRKSTRLNSSHPSISYAVFCLK